MRNFNITITKKLQDGQSISFDYRFLTEAEKRQLQMVAIEVLDSLVLNDDCREAKEYLKRIQEA